MIIRSRTYGMLLGVPAITAVYLWDVVFCNDSRHREKILIFHPVFYSTSSPCLDFAQPWVQNEEPICYYNVGSFAHLCTKGVDAKVYMTSWKPLWNPYIMTLYFRKLPSMRGKHQLTAGPQHTESEPEVKPQPHHLSHFIPVVRQKANSHITGWLWPPETHTNKHSAGFLNPTAHNFLCDWLVRSCHQW